MASSKSSSSSSLGANLALGTSLGFAGLTAAIVGSVVNALAAMVLTTLIQTVSTALFGEKLGALLGAILGFVVFNVITSFTNLGSFNWASLFRVDNLMKLTDALANGYANYVQAGAADLAQQGQSMMEEYNKQRDQIEDLFAKNIGYANTELDPWGYSHNMNLYSETRDTFLTRTLMTGSDIADLSNGLLTDFTELTLRLPNQFTT